MRLKVLLPTHLFLEREVTRVVAEAENGEFCLLPRHVDFATALVPGLLSYTPSDDDGNEEFLGVDEGVLVKQADEVLVSTRRAVRGPELGTVRRTVEEEFRVVDERERTARSAMAKLEADFFHRFLELGERRA